MTEEEYNKAVEYISDHFNDDPLPDDFMALVLKVEEYEEIHYFPGNLNDKN